MFTVHWLLLIVLLSLVAKIEGLPQADPSIDLDDPNKSDPTSFPDHNFKTSGSRGPNPFLNGIPTLPDACDSYNLTEDCFQALKDVGEGAKVYFEKGHGKTALN